MLALLVGLAALAYQRFSRPLLSDKPTRHDARQAIARGEFSEALEFCESMLASDAADADVLLIAADAATRLDRLAEAQAYYDRVPDSAIEEAAFAHCAVGTILMQQGRLANSELRLRHSLRLAPDFSEANMRLGTLLALEGRRWESLPYLLTVLESGNAGLQELAILGNVDQTLEEEEFLQRCLRVAPDDIEPKLGLARIAHDRGETAEARSLLTEIISRRPALVEAHARLGLLLVEYSPDDLSDWNTALPANAEAHPDIWLVRGRWARHHDQPQLAAQCFWQAASRHPNHYAAVYELVQSLKAIGASSAAVAELTQRAERLLALKNLLEQIWQDRDSRQLPRRIAAVLESLDRNWEAVAWLEWNAQLASQSKEIQHEIDRVVAVASTERSPLVTFFQLPVQVNLPVSLPVDWSRLASDSIPLRPTSGVRFHDSAADVGIDFTYFNSPDPNTEGMRMFEFTGGGVAVLDFDGDNWPDLYFTQGCHWPPNEDQHEFIDRCYRNLGNGRFVDVTLSASLGDARFGQGCTVGDFDGDGFADLYVANIGRNRLYRNNGDGTFADISDAAGVTGGEWTTSCLLTDLTGDSFPDIYDVNYLSGENAFTQICQQAGVSRACDQGVFEAEYDHTFDSLGDGRFVEAADSLQQSQPKRAGLGIIAADFEHRGRLDLFVANDAQPNFYLVNRRRDDAAGFWEDRGFPSGLAFDGAGRPQACMGVAAGDANDDGWLDLFVTNFYDEPNTLYQQGPGGMFQDATREAALAAPSMLRLGFGTQFIDGELDGLPDLVLVNGDVDDFSHRGRPFRQTPQYFQNLGHGRFAELAAEELGAFFSRPQLGRSLAKLDWNRDGREDFVVSHLDTPAALLTNDSATGHYLAIQLRGVESNRDAIGTRVEVSAGDKRLRQQLIAGDGYQASNQRVLVFGLGSTEQAQEIRVHWPSGREQSYAEKLGDCEVLLIEGHSPIWALPR